MMTPEQAANVIQRAWLKYRAVNSYYYDEYEYKEAMDEIQKHLDKSNQEWCERVEKEFDFNEQYPDRPQDYEGMWGVISSYDDYDY